MTSDSGSVVSPVVYRPRKQPAMFLQWRIQQLPVGVTDDVSSKSGARIIPRAAQFKEDDIRYLMMAVVH